MTRVTDSRHGAVAICTSWDIFEGRPQFTGGVTDGCQLVRGTGKEPGRVGPARPRRRHDVRDVRNGGRHCTTASVCWPGVTFCIETVTGEVQNMSISELSIITWKWPMPWTGGVWPAAQLGWKPEKLRFSGTWLAVILAPSPGETMLTFHFMAQDGTAIWAAPLG